MSWSSRPTGCTFCWCLWPMYTLMLVTWWLSRWFWQENSLLFANTGLGLTSWDRQWFGMGWRGSQLFPAPSRSCNVWSPPFRWAVDAPRWGLRTLPRTLDQLVCAPIWVSPSQYQPCDIGIDTPSRPESSYQSRCVVSSEQCLDSWETTPTPCNWGESQGSGVEIVQIYTKNWNI